ncbi:MAG TPA: hypothetical protein VHS58_04800 [Acetobacteraceae bacterium]|nr:hypothetical protein [Acetobacteraceae bacterium]
MPRFGILALVVLLVAGCALIDRSTFRRAGKAPEASQLARADLPQLPLLTIRFDNLDADYMGSVAQAVEAVNAIKPDAQYDVVTLIPTSAPESVQNTAAQNGQEDAAAVVQALGYAGVSLDNVHVGIRGDAGSPPREVLVFAR